MVNQHTGNHGLGIFGVAGFDLGPLLQGQMRTAKLKEPVAPSTQLNTTS